MEPDNTVAAMRDRLLATITTQGWTPEVDAAIAALDWALGDEPDAARRGLSVLMSVATQDADHRRRVTKSWTE